MKNLVFIILALLAVNISFGAEMGESQKSKCSAAVQSDRNQAVLEDQSVNGEVTSSDESVDQ